MSFNAIIIIENDILISFALNGALTPNGRHWAAASKQNGKTNK